MASKQDNAVLVDTTPISPVKEGTLRRNSLEKHLQHRPDRKELIEHNILKTSAAPSLQAKQQELERQRVADSLKKGLENRSEPEELVEKNILFKSTVAPGIQSQQKELERQMRADNLEKELARRPTADEVVKKGILTADETPISA